MVFGKDNIPFFLKSPVTEHKRLILPQGGFSLKTVKQPGKGFDKSCFARSI